MGIGAPIHKDDVLSDLDYVAGSIGIAADGRSSAAGRSADVVIALLTIFMRLPSNRYSPPDNRDRASPETPHHGVPTMTLSLRRSALVSAACLVGLLCLASGSVLATADGPDFYRVVDVGATSALNIRAKPGPVGPGLRPDVERARRPDIDDPVEVRPVGRREDAARCQAEKPHETGRRDKGRPAQRKGHRCRSMMRGLGRSLA